MASDEESSQDEADKDGIQPSVLKQRLNRIILICFYAFQTLRVWEVQAVIQDHEYMYIG